MSGLLHATALYKHQTILHSQREAHKTNLLKKTQDGGEPNLVLHSLHDPTGRTAHECCPEPSRAAEAVHGVPGPERAPAWWTDPLVDPVSSFGHLPTEPDSAASHDVTCILISSLHSPSYGS
jgi:hypothetical protein